MNSKSSSVSPLGCFALMGHKVSNPGRSPDIPEPGMRSRETVHKR